MKFNIFESYLFKKKKKKKKTKEGGERRRERERNKIFNRIVVTTNSRT